MIFDDVMFRSASFQSQIRSPLTRNDRTKFNTVLIIDVHARVSLTVSSGIGKMSSQSLASKFAPSSFPASLFTIGCQMFYHIVCINCTSFDGFILAIHPTWLK